jgi:MOSC domain-containing protein YiiM
MRIVSISVGKIEKFSISGDGPPRSVKSAINKRPISQRTDPVPIFVGALGLELDAQADLTVHGGADKAVYVYPAEHYAFWANLLVEQSIDLGLLEHGFFGENLTVEGLIEHEVFVGDLWSIGEVELMVEALRVPCFKFNSKIGFDQAGPTMVRTARSGWYLSVLQPGVLKAGDKIAVTPGAREMSIAEQNARLKIKRKL